MSGCDGILLLFSEIVRIFTVLVDLLLLPDEPVHPNAVIVVKYDTLIIWALGPVFFQDVDALFILTQLE